MYRPGSTNEQSMVSGSKVVPELCLWLSEIGLEMNVQIVTDGFTSDVLVFDFIFDK